MAGISPQEYAAKLAADPLFFIEQGLKITPKKGGLVPFVLNDEQLRFFRAFWDKWTAKEPVRIIVLKARQRGISTITEALLYWLVSTRHHTNSLVLSHDLDSARHILQMSHRFAQYDGRRKHDLMPGMAKSNRAEIVFDNPDWRSRGEQPGLDSRMVVATADNKNAGHSFTFQAFHGSEVARWPRADLVTGVMAALPDAPETLAVLESTACGRSGYFYETWKAAEKGRNEWLPHFIAWHTAQEYRTKLTPKTAERFANTLTETELLLWKEKGLDLEQLAWRRKKISEFEGMGRPAEDVFREQYPSTPEEAFISSGRAYFDMNRLVKMEEASKVAKYQDGWLEAHGVLNNRPEKVEFHERRALMNRAGNLRVWKHPEPGADYVIGADCAMGLSGGDYSVGYVMRRDTYEFVARLRGQIEPDEFADQLVDLAWYYNEAFLLPENNSIGMAVTRRTSSKYVRHGYQVDASQPWNPRYDFDKPGWNTNAKNRREMLAQLRQMFRDGHLYIWCEDFLSECNDFVVPETLEGHLQEDRPRAITHKKDDCVLAAAITLQANDPMLSGPIQKRVSVQEFSEDWRIRAIQIANAKQKEPKLDEHMGAFI